jgi:hypothetical protein
LPALRTSAYKTPSTINIPLAFLPLGPSPFCSMVAERMLTPVNPSGPPSMRARPRLSFSFVLGTKPVPSP